MIFTAGASDDIKAAIATAKTVFFTSVPGIGKKNAERIIIELKDKIGFVGLESISVSELKENEEVLVALTSLGYSISEARAALLKVKTKGKTIEDKIKLALKVTAKQ